MGKPCFFLEFRALNRMVLGVVGSVGLGIRRLLLKGFIRITIRGIMGGLV